MKRKSIVAIILVLVLCFTMTACGGNPEVEPAVGEWVSVNAIVEDDVEEVPSEFSSIVINKDGTGNLQVRIVRDIDLDFTLEYVETDTTDDGDTRHTYIVYSAEDGERVGGLMCVEEMGFLSFHADGGLAIGYAKTNK